MQSPPAAPTRPTNTTRVSPENDIVAINFCRNCDIKYQINGGEKNFMLNAPQDIFFGIIANFAVQIL